MSKDNNNLKQAQEEICSAASTCLEKNGFNEIPSEIFEITRLIARIAVDEYFNEVKKGYNNK